MDESRFKKIGIFRVYTPNNIHTSRDIFSTDFEPLLHTNHVYTI